MREIPSDELDDLRRISAGAALMTEGELQFVFLPALHLPPGCTPQIVDALLRPCRGSDGYTTRLFLSNAFPSKGQNWTTHHILGRTWHAFSYNEVPAEMRLIEILLNHLRVLQ